MSSKGQGDNHRSTRSATVIPLRTVIDEATQVQAGIDALVVHLMEALVDLGRVAEDRRADVSDIAQLAAELLSLCASGVVVSQHGTIEAVNAIGDGQVRRRDFLNTVKVMGGAALVGRVEQHLALSRRTPLVEGREQVASITAITGNYRRLEGMTPTEQLREPALQHLRLAGRLADEAPDRLRPALAAAASEASGFAGWLMWDLGDHAAARHHYEEAIKRAHEAEQSLLAAYMVGSMSLWAAAVGQGDQAVALSEQAYALLQAAGRTPPAATVWMALVEATARASDNDAKAMDGALGRAEQAASHAQDVHEPVWPWVYPIDQAKIAGYRGACYTKLKLPGRALPALHQALPAGSPTSKQHGLLVCDLATSYLYAGEVEEACRLAAAALAVGRKRRSPRVIHRVRDFRAQLDPHRHGDCARQLDEQLLAVVLNP